MLSTSLKQCIHHYIDLVGVVPHDQINAFFSQRNPETVQWCLSSLVVEHEILYDQTTDTYKATYANTKSQYAQSTLTLSGWVLAGIGETKIREFFPERYPNQLLFITEDNKVCDLMVFTVPTQRALCMLVKSSRQARIPAEETDEIVHLALVSDRQMGEELAPYQFDYYIVLGRDKLPTFYKTQKGGQTE